MRCIALAQAWQNYDKKAISLDFFSRSSHFFMEDKDENKDEL
jgi:hypothetical protein